MSRTCERTDAENVEPIPSRNDGSNAAEDRGGQETWPRAAWSQALASNA